MSNMVYIPVNTVVFDAPNNEEGKMAALEYVKFQGMTTDDAGIKRAGSRINVVLKKVMLMPTFTFRSDVDFNAWRKYQDSQAEGLAYCQKQKKGY